MSVRPATKAELRELVSKIAALTGKRPTSRDPRHLRNRLADLEARVAAGEDVRRVTGSVVRSISLPTAAGTAFDRILAREGVSASELVRRALASWAARHGYKVEAEEMEAGR